MAAFNDKGDVTELVASELRMKSGARILPRSPQIFDHFCYGAGAINSHVPQNWVVTETGAATPFAPSATAAGGHVVAVTGGTTNNGQELAGKNVGWKPSTMATNARLVLEVRAKFVGATTPTDGDFVIGFADAVTYTNSLPYVVGLTSLYTTTAPVEFAGFHYSSIPTSGTLFTASGNVVGIATEKASTATLAASTGVVKDSLFHVYRVELTVDGHAAFFIDDVKVGTQLSAVTASVALTPYVCAIAKASHAQTATVDYIYVGGDLV